MAQVHNENRGKKKSFFPDDFGVPGPRHSEAVSAKKRFTFIVACVTLSLCRTFQGPVDLDVALALVNVAPESYSTRPLTTTARNSSKRRS